MTDVLHTFVYGLHEGDYDFWYVGMTRQKPGYRLVQHRRCNPHATPDTQLHVLEDVTGTLEEVRPVEQEWIDGLRAVGYPLVNTERQDIPYNGYIPDAVRQRMSVSHRGKKHPPEVRAKIGRSGEANPAKRDDVRAKISAAGRGRVPWNKGGAQLTDETKAKMRAAQIRRYERPGERERISAARRKAAA